MFNKVCERETIGNGGAVNKVKGDTATKRRNKQKINLLASACTTQTSSNVDDVMFDKTNVGEKMSPNMFFLLPFFQFNCV